MSSTESDTPRSTRSEYSFFYHNGTDFDPDNIPGLSDCNAKKISDPDSPVKISVEIFGMGYGGSILLEDMTRHDLSAEEIRDLSCIWAKSGNLFLCPIFAKAVLRDESYDLEPGEYYAFASGDYVNLVPATAVAPGRIS